MGGGKQCKKKKGDRMGKVGWPMSLPVGSEVISGGSRKQGGEVGQSLGKKKGDKRQGLVRV